MTEEKLNKSKETFSTLLELKHATEIYSKNILDYSRPIALLLTEDENNQLVELFKNIIKPKLQAQAALFESL